MILQQPQSAPSRFFEKDIDEHPMISLSKDTPKEGGHIIGCFISGRISGAGKTPSKLNHALCYDIL